MACAPEKVSGAALRVVARACAVSGAKLTSRAERNRDLLREVGAAVRHVLELAVGAHRLRLERNHLGKGAEVEGEGYSRPAELGLGLTLLHRKYQNGRLAQLVGPGRRKRG